LSTGQNNFLTFDPNLTNADSDVQYAAETAVQNGLSTGLASVLMHNKLFHQVTVMMKALANFVAAQGHDALDTSESALTAALTAAINPASGALAAIGASTKEQHLTSTNQTIVATFTPAANQNLLIGVSARIASATTVVSAEVDYTDAGGNAATQTFYTNVSMPVGSNPTLMILINANAAPVSVKVTAGTANNAYASASIVEV